MALSISMIALFSLDRSFLVSYAKQLLDYFVMSFQQIYGKYLVSYNVQQLCDDYDKYRIIIVIHFCLKIT